MNKKINLNNCVVLNETDKSILYRCTYWRSTSDYKEYKIYDDTEYSVWLPKSKIIDGCIDLYFLKWVLKKQGLKHFCNHLSMLILTNKDHCSHGDNVDKETWDEYNARVLYPT